MERGDTARNVFWKACPWERLGDEGEIQPGGSGRGMERANGTKQHRKLDDRETEIPSRAFLLRARDSAG